ncbi:hypothetical protein FHG87_015401 [Trinorchestia longiramus]|nr:hypothetical protein FHG87_015401 [Trinorchestia longiramus]
MGLKAAGHRSRTTVRQWLIRNDLVSIVATDTRRSTKAGDMALSSALDAYKGPNDLPLATSILLLIPYRPPGGVEEMQGSGRKVRLEWGRLVIYNIQ